VITIDLGRLIGRASTYIIDVDPFCAAPDGDTRKIQMAVALPPPRPAQRDRHRAIEHRILSAVRRVEFFSWQKNSEDFLAAINATRLIPRTDRVEAIAGILKKETGRLVAVLRSTIHHANLWYRTGLTSDEARRLGRLLRAARGKPYDLSAKTLLIVETLRVRMAEHLCAGLVYGPFSMTDLYNLFQGLTGGALAIGTLADRAGIRRRRRTLPEVVTLSRRLDRAVATAAQIK